MVNVAKYIIHGSYGNWKQSPASIFYNNKHLPLSHVENFKTLVRKSSQFRSLESVCRERVSDLAFSLPSPETEKHQGNLKLGGKKERKMMNFPETVGRRFKRPIFQGSICSFFSSVYMGYIFWKCPIHIALSAHIFPCRQPPNDCWMNQLWPSVWRAHLQQGSLLRKWRRET